MTSESFQDVSQFLKLLNKILLGSFDETNIYKNYNSQKTNIEKVFSEYALLPQRCGKEVFPNKTYGILDEWMGRWMFHQWMAEWMNGWVDGWVN